MTKEIVVYGRLISDDIYILDNELIVNTKVNDHGEIILVDKNYNLVVELDYKKTKDGWSVNISNLRDALNEGNFVFAVRHEIFDKIVISEVKLLSKKNILLKNLGIDSRRKKLYTSIYINANNALACSKCDYEKTRYLAHDQATQVITADNFIIKDNNFSFNINKEEDVKYNEAFINILSKDEKKRVRAAAKIEGNKVSFTLTNDIIHSLPIGKFFVELDLFTDEVIYKSKLYFNNKNNNNTSHIINVDSKISIYIFISRGGEIRVHKDRTYSVYRKKIGCNLKLKMLKKIANKGYKFTIEVQATNSIDIKKVSLVSRNSNSEVEANIKSLISKNDNKYIIHGVLNLDLKNISGLYWDLLVLVDGNDGYEEYIRVNNARRILKAWVAIDYFSKSIRTKDLILYPYITIPRDISFILRNREFYETKTSSIKVTVAYVLYKLLKKIYFDKKNIWLGFEKFSQTAQDNGYAFFKYVDSQKKHPNFYYIIDPNTQAYKDIKDTSNKIVKLMSFKYMILIFAANLLVASETKRHAYNLRIKTDLLSRAIYNKKSVFLQHGVTAFKRSDVFKKVRGRGNFNLVIATSEMEKNIIEENWLYNPEEIVITGFPRWDNLADKSYELNKRKIFVMPTWRTWVEGLSPKEFKETDYYKNYTSFLCSERLNDILEKNNVKLVFFLHPKFQSYSSNFTVATKNIEIKEASRINVQDEVKEASLLVSDYSSVTWDMYYMNKPVIFFQFDYAEYNANEGSYIDMRTDLFGDRSLNVESLIDNIDDSIKNNFKIKTKYTKLRNTYFKYIDHNNSKRVLSAINKVIK